MDFNKRVAIVVSMVPAGRVATYGQIAELCGMPNYARHVGGALTNKLPAHRIINAQGDLSGADRFETPSTQQERLTGEGVVMNGYRHLDLSEYQWQPTWEELIYIEDAFVQEGI